jgi:hypothetical protein
LPIYVCETLKTGGHPFLTSQYIFPYVPDHPYTNISLQKAFRYEYLSFRP